MRRSVSGKISLDDMMLELNQAIKQKTKFGNEFNFPWSETQWQQTLREAVQNPAELLRLLELTSTVIQRSAERSEVQSIQRSVTTKDLLQLLLACDEGSPALTAGSPPSFKLRVPRSFIARMRKQDPHDPLFLQVWPSQQEQVSPKHYLLDPLQEQQQNQLPGLLHKYSSRVLLIGSGVCAVHCRYCFRQHFDYAENNPGRKGWDSVFDYIKSHPDVSEVIVSGGDPWMNSDRYLADFVQSIADLPQIERLRFHTRIPIVLPERITHGLLNALKSRLKTVVVFHANHPNEIDEAVSIAAAALQKAGIVLLNQSVLLKGINDDVSVLKLLSERLFSIGVLPYYLHLLDKVKGTAHFAVSRQKAKRIARGLLAALPGYLVPKLVEEKPGEASKIGV